MSADNGTDLELSATRWIPAAPGEVWTAATTKAALERWWSPEELRTSIRRLEVHPGGMIAFHVTYLPALLSPTSKESFTAARVPIAFDLRGTFSELVEPSRLTFDLTLELGKAGAGIPMSTRMDLEPEGAGTPVTLTGRGQGTPHWRTLGTRNLEASSNGSRVRSASARKALGCRKARRTACITQWSSPGSWEKSTSPRRHVSGTRARFVATGDGPPTTHLTERR
jgi:uncharacterized protein YndB with AHSA1/START domain